MFDGSVTSQTKSQTKSSRIIVTLTIDRPTDTLALLNISAYDCYVTFTDNVSGVVYNNYHDLSVEGMPGEYETDLLVTGVAGFNSGTVFIYLSKGALGGSACAVGACLLGLAVDVGGAQYGASAGIQDFSIIEPNTFGDYDITERAYSKWGSFQVMVPTVNVARVFRILSEQRAKKTLFIGSDSYALTAIYGFPDDWSVVIQYEDYSVLNIRIKGLT